MKKAIVVCVCALLGLTAGYFAAPPASFWYVQSSDPKMFGAFALFVVDSFIVCNCDKQPAAETLQTLTSNLSILQRWQVQDRPSKILAQEIGMAQVRASRLERDLGHDTQADEYMKQGQAELKALGWRDVSPAHLEALTKQLNSERLPAHQKSRTVATTK